MIGNGHNGYLDVWLEMGFVRVGAVPGDVLHRCPAGLFAPCLRPGQAWPGKCRHRRVVLSLVILLYSLIYSLTEKFLLEQSELTWVLILTTLLYLTPRRAAAVYRSNVPVQAYPAPGE